MVRRRACGGRPARRPTTEGAEQPEFGGFRASSGFFLVGGWCSACASSERRRIRFTVSPDVHDVGVVEQPVQRRRRRHWHPAESFPGEHSFRASVRVGARERHRVRNLANGPASRQNLARRRGAPACVTSTRAGVMLEDCQLTVRLPPFHGGGRRELARRPRVYRLDTRLVRHLRGWTHLRPADRGLLRENLVLDELLTAVPGPAGRDRVAAMEAKISPDAFDPKPRLDFGTPVPTDRPALLPVRDGARPSLVARHGGYCLRSLAVGATASGPAAVAAGGNWNGLFARWIR